MAAATARSARDPFIDLLRVVSMAVVLLMHWLTPLITVRDGGIRVEILPSGPIAWVVSWFIQVMPVIFLAGGVANTAVATAYRGRYAQYLAVRGGRLVVPAAVLVGVVALVATSAGALGHPQIGQAVSLSAVKPLWFLAVYLVVLAVAPAMVAAQRRFGAAVPVALAVAALAVDALRFAGHEWVVVLNYAFVWLFAHQLGIGYALGALRRARSLTLAALGLAAVATCVFMVAAGPYPPSMIGLSDVPVSNLAPPTGALVALAVAQFAAITWLARRFTPALTTDRWRRFLDDANAPLMTVYLWHLPAMVLLVGAGLLLPDLILPAAGIHWWLIRPLWLANCALILVVLTRLWHRFETVRLPALGTRTGPATALAGTALAAAAIGYVWQHGATLNGTGAAGRIAAVLALGCSLVLLAYGQPRTRRDTPVRATELNLHHPMHRHHGS
ncbi:acyltransferase [Dactylosporangium sp. AC04546]|uniref:acyltransferase n=1 Tax=Dactylosporangium sp. AC04546 TaxID=2862460 RepID=UPI001EDED847|nr:acyltransferase [Dactylosporangium sp. AC04546]WVK88685.1 acyltransferase [Dactylosporangium sp. AC04546]